jgi:hypothetical protein
VSTGHRRTSAVGYTSNMRLSLVPVSFGELVGAARRIASEGGRAHIHTTVPGCAITGSSRRAIVLEDTDGGRTYAFFDDLPIEERAKPLAVLLHGAESVPRDDDQLEPASESVQRMAERFLAGRGHFHILSPSCLVNPHVGRWTILFEDDERGAVEQVTDVRPLADIRFVERLIYARS